MEILTQASKPMSHVEFKNKPTILNWRCISR